jgi:hypothetical protein
MASINEWSFDYEQFDFAHLRAVVSIAETQPLDGDALTLTVTSIEQYEAGFAANLLFEEIHDAASGPSVPFHAMPAITARDERGNEYQGRLRAGFGGGGRGRSEMREVYNFAPALPDDVRTLMLEVSFVTQLAWDVHGTPQWTDADIVAGPFTATFTLPERA